MARSMYSSLNPNTVYTGPNGAQYDTDEHGRIETWNAQVRDETAARNPYAQYTLEGKNPDQSHAGHLLASSQGGSGEKYNMVPMNDKVNTRDYRAFEKENDQLVQEGYTVNLSGSNAYAANSEGKNIPEAIMVDREVSLNGEHLYTEHSSWTNLDMEEFEGKGETEAAELYDQFDNPGAFIYNDEEEIAVNYDTGEVVDVNGNDLSPADAASGMEDSGGESEGLSDSDSMTL